MEKINISNKIISIEKIIEIADYLESQAQKYSVLFNEDKEKNENLQYSDRKYMYDGKIPKTQYKIEFLDGKSMIEPDYNWFVDMLKQHKNIKRIDISLQISYSSNYENVNEYQYKHLDIFIDFYDERIYLNIEGKELEKEVNIVYSDIRSILEDTPNKYDKTIKNSKLRMQSFFISIGLILSYIIYIILFLNINKISEELIPYITNKYVLIILQWFIAIIIGTLLGTPIMDKLYKDILPNKKFLTYSKSSQKSVFIDDVEEYISNNEVQIGKFYNSIERRSKVERLFKISRIIILCQLIIDSIIILIFR